MTISKFVFIPRKCFYLKAGNISKHKASVNKGCTRTYTVNEKEREHIMFFSFEDWWIADFESYYTQQPAREYNQAMEDCELLCISKCDLDKLEDTGGAFDYFIVQVAPKSGPPLHVHHFQEETIHVLKGHFKVRIEDKIFFLTEGGLLTCL